MCTVLSVTGRFGIPLPPASLFARSRERRPRVKPFTDALKSTRPPAGKLYQDHGVLGSRSEGLTYMLALFTLQKRETTRRKKCERIPVLHAKARSEEFKNMADVTSRQSQRGELLLGVTWSIRAPFE